jgi:F-type H+-transporting ATPase subunit b
MMAIRFLSVLALALVLSTGAFAASDAKASAKDAPHHETTVPEEATSSDDVAGPAAATDEAQAPHEAAEEHGEGGLPQLNFGTYPSQIFWLLVMFAVLFTVFSKKTLPTIGAVIAAREDKIKGDLATAEYLRNKAEEIQLAYEQNLERARAAAVQAVQDVESASKKRAEEQVNDFRKKSETELSAAERRMNDVRVKAMDGMTSVAAEVASAAAEKITGIGADVQNAKTIVESLASKAKAA